MLFWPLGDESIADPELLADRQAQARIRSGLVGAEARLEQAEYNLEKTVIRSPLDGVVSQLFAEQGEVVITGTMNNPGTVIMVVADMSNMKAILEVDETDVVSLELGQEATVEVDALPDLLKTEAFGGAHSAYLNRGTTMPPPRSRPRRHP